MLLRWYVGLCAGYLSCNVVLRALFNFAIILLRMRELVDSFQFFLLSCGFLCSVSLHQVAMGCSLVCDYGIS